jgi:hypothetical protein
MGGADWGIRDPTVLLMGAIDPDNGITYIYDEYYRPNLPVPEHARHMLEMVQKDTIRKTPLLSGRSIRKTEQY